MFFDQRLEFLPPGTKESLMAWASGLNDGEGRVVKIQHDAFEYPIALYKVADEPTVEGFPLCFDDVPFLNRSIK